MNSTTLVQAHVVVVTLFVLIYLIKTVLIFTNQNALAKFNKAIKVPEMIISVLFLVTGIWQFVILGAIKMLQIFKLACVLVAIPLAIVGFKKLNKALALISFVLLVTAYGLAEMCKGEAFIPKTVVIQGDGSDEFNLGAKTYGANCSMCHGIDGKKQYRGAKDLSVSTISAEGAMDRISDGIKGRMPAFKNVLTNDDIAAAAKYIQTLKGK